MEGIAKGKLVQLYIIAQVQLNTVSIDPPARVLAEVKTFFHPVITKFQD